MTNADNPAFPNSNSDAVGLTKREWLAGIICSGFVSNEMLMKGHGLMAKNDDEMCLAVATASVKQADALINALNSPQPPH